MGLHPFWVLMRDTKQALAVDDIISGLSACRNERLADVLEADYYGSKVVRRLFYGAGSEIM